MVPEEEAPANYVPAAAVIRRVQALFGITGRKGRVGGFVSRIREIPRLNLGTAGETADLECWRGWRNSRCRSEICRYLEEHRRRRRLPGQTLTLRRESVGIKQD